MEKLELFEAASKRFIRYYARDLRESVYSNFPY